MAYISNYLSMGIKPIYKIINENKLLEIICCYKVYGVKQHRSIFPRKKNGRAIGVL